MAFARPGLGALDFSRLLVYDQRGNPPEETSLILEQKNGEVHVWFNDSMGKRSGEVPPAEYRDCFQAMLAISSFSQKPEYRGRLLRAHAARGTVLLAWEDNQGKQIKSIHYFAPEHTQDNFRAAFNRIWALSRYAILSLQSFESPRAEFLEDAVYFSSGAGWMTAGEVQDVMRFHHARGTDQRVVRAVWQALKRRFSDSSEFSHRPYLEYCVSKNLCQLKSASLDFLAQNYSFFSPEQQRLAGSILAKIRKNGQTGEETKKP